MNQATAATWREPAAAAGLSVDDPDSEVLSLKGLAKLMGVPVHTVKEWRWKAPEKVPPAFQGYPLRWLRSTVVSFLNDRVDDPYNDVLSIKGLAKIMGVSERTIENNRWRAPGKVPPVFQTKPLRWRRETVLAFMKAQESMRRNHPRSRRDRVSTMDQAAGECR